MMGTLFSLTSCSIPLHSPSIPSPYALSHCTLPLFPHRMLYPTALSLYSLTVCSIPLHSPSPRALSHCTLPHLVLYPTALSLYSLTVCSIPLHSPSPRALSHCTLPLFPHRMLYPTILSLCVLSDCDKVHILVPSVIACYGATGTHISIQPEYSERMESKS